MTNVSRCGQKPNRASKNYSTYTSSAAQADSAHPASLRSPAREAHVGRRGVRVLVLVLLVTARQYLLVFVVFLDAAKPTL